MPHRQNPARRLIVMQRVFRVYRGAQFGQALVELVVTNQYLAFEHRIRHREYGPTRVVAKGFLHRNQLAGLKKSSLFRARRLDVVLCRIRNAPGRVAKRAREYHKLPVIVPSQDLVPPAETDEYFIRHGYKLLAYRRVLFDLFLRHSLHHRANVFDSEIPLAGHHGGVSEHMLIVGRVENDETLRLTEDRAIAAVGLDCFQVGGDGLRPVTDSNIDMRMPIYILSESRLQVA